MYFLYSDGSINYLAPSLIAVAALAFTLVSQLVYLRCSHFDQFVIVPADTDQILFGCLVDKFFLLPLADKSKLMSLSVLQSFTSTQLGSSLNFCMSITNATLSGFRCSGGVLRSTLQKLHFTKNWITRRFQNVVDPRIQTCCPYRSPLIRITMGHSQHQLHGLSRTCLDLTVCFLPLFLFLWFWHLLAYPASRDGRRIHLRPDHFINIVAWCDSRQNVSDSGPNWKRICDHPIVGHKVRKRILWFFMYTDIDSRVLHSILYFWCGVKLVPKGAHLPELDLSCHNNSSLWASCKERSIIFLCNDLSRPFGMVSEVISPATDLHKPMSRAISFGPRGRANPKSISVKCHFFAMPPNQECHPCPDKAPLVPGRLPWLSCYQA